MLEFQNIKLYLLKDIFQIISKIKNTVSWTYNISDLNGEEITGIFYEKELRKANQKEFRIEKVLKKKKVINYMSNGTDMIIVLIFVLIKKTLCKNESVLS